MDKPFSQKFQVRWADIDANRHMRHTAYNDYAAQLRLSVFEHYKINFDHLMSHNIGPILFREETIFRREVPLNEVIEVTAAIQKMRMDTSRWSIVHTVYRSDGELAAIINVDGAWLDLEKRKLTIPFEELKEALLQMPRTEDFEWTYPKEA